MIQRRWGNSPRVFLLAFMLLGLSLSFCVSNVASSLLCTTLVVPLLQDFPSDCAYTKALLLGVAVACNVGGMLSPISSPQNAVSLGVLAEEYQDHVVSFGQWVAVAVPLGIVSTVLSWVYIVTVVIRDDTRVSHIPALVFERKRLTLMHWIVISVSLVVILMWATLAYSKPYLGDLGTVALLPLVIFFSLGILDKNDLKGLASEFFGLIIHASSLSVFVEPDSVDHGRERLGGRRDLFAAAAHHRGHHRPLPRGRGPLDDVPDGFDFRRTGHDVCLAHRRRADSVAHGGALGQLSKPDLDRAAGPGIDSHDERVHVAAHVIVSQRQRLAGRRRLWIALSAPARLPHARVRRLPGTIPPADFLGIFGAERCF
jgi:hypothetical protein